MNAELLNNLVGSYFVPALLCIVMMALLYLIYVSEAALGAGAWTFLMVVFLLLILRFGIYRHLVGYDENQYFSRSAWGAAIAINIFGVAVLSLSLF